MRILFRIYLFHLLLAKHNSPIDHAPILNISEDISLRLLRNIFRKESFWEGQWESLERILQQRDSLILMPTGSGKSIIFQLASLMLPGMALVVDPLISLIKDQVENLKLYGIDRSYYISSDLSVQLKSESLALLGAGEFIYYYVTPERFQRADFQEKLRELARLMCINMVVVDEVHCVSEWGHDFRPAYIALASTARDCCRKRDYIPPIVGLTGTASHPVLRDVQRELSIADREAIVTLHNFDRKELEFVVKKVPVNEKKEHILDSFQGLPDLFNEKKEDFFNGPKDKKKCGLIFFPFRQGKNYDITIQGARDYLGVTDYYCGEKPKFFIGTDYEWSRHKNETAVKFKNNTIQFLLCTKAFGMGIDKPNIQSTLHVCLPPSPEAFYQEAGRAGRNRERSYCVLLYSHEEEKPWNIFLMIVYHLKILL